MSKKRTDRPEIDLKEYMPPDRFRTVENFDMPGAPSELRADIELHDAFMKKLTFRVPWDGELYAYARPLPAFYKLCEENGLFADGTAALYFQDWDTKFLLTIEKTENGRRRVLTFFVPSEDMRYLLENCRRIREQRENK